MRWWRGASALICSCVVLACEGVIHDPGATTPGEDPRHPGSPSSDGGAAVYPDGEILPPPELCTELQPAEVPLRRLTLAQFQNAVRDLFDGQVSVGDTPYPGSTGQSVTGFSTEPGINTVDELAVEQFMNAAEEVALQIPSVLSSILPCAGAADDACAHGFIDSVGRRAFRRMLESDERTTLRSVYAEARTDGASFGESLGMVVVVLLQSPQFLYLAEIGTGDDPARRLTANELALRLSILFWDSIPDEELLDAAESGSLETPDHIATQARRLLEDSRSEDGLRRFFREWLQVREISPSDRDTERFADFDTDVAHSMSEAFNRLAISTVLNGGSYHDLLTRNGVMVDETLAGFLGVTDADFSEGAWVFVPSQRHPGIIGQPLTMATHAHHAESSYVFRGRTIAVGLLCQELGDPPGDALEVAGELQSSLPVEAPRREVSDAIRSSSGCRPCHNVLDPPGLAFEHFDAVGRFRDVDTYGNDIEVAGQLQMPGREVRFENPSELMEAVAQSAEGRACFAKQWYRFFSSRMNRREDDCALSEIVAAGQDNGGSLQQMMIALTQTDAFLYRLTPEAP